ncbi:unnamed protein product [Vicia faba]|uniref:Uncharacterized protein n=1 Tax=Vicia faba TaxID=3906 RepID=A0AAV1AWE9_VICFA|nr:unnamed protein product [Vicia faba]
MLWKVQFSPFIKKANFFWTNFEIFSSRNNLIGRILKFSHVVIISFVVINSFKSLLNIVTAIDFYYLFCVWNTRVYSAHTVPTSNVNPPYSKAFYDLKESIVKGLGFTAKDGIKIMRFEPREARVGHFVEYQFDVEIDNKLAGPMELWIQDDKDMRISLPHDVEAGVLKKVVLADGVVVTVKGARIVSLIDKKRVFISVQHFHQPIIKFQTPNTLKKLYLTGASFISAIIVFGGLIAPKAERTRKMGAW